MSSQKRKKKRKSTRRKKSFGFGSISIPASSSPSKMTHYELLGLAGSFVAGTILSHAIGNNLIGVGTGLVIGGAGGYKKNAYLTSLGVGMIFSSPASSVSQNMNGLPEDEVNGFNLKNFTSGAKLRVGSFFSSFKDKFRLPKAAEETPAAPAATEEEGTNGMGNIYKSPFTQIPAPNMAELDRLEAQIEQMNGLFGDDMPNREF
jgi:hypothetical protein